MKKKSLFLIECLVKAAIFILLMFLIFFLFGCSKPVEQNTSNGQILYFEIENPPNTMWKTYTIEEEQIDLFQKWQERQPNELAQKDWDAYMGDENDE